jgi:putative Holliday junction resolvase
MVGVGGEKWQRGVRLGIDVGKVRVGVAVCDPDGILATPLVTVARAAAPQAGPSTAAGVTRRPTDAGRTRADLEQTPADLRKLAELVAEYDAVEVVVGLPVTLAGQEGPAATEAREYAQALARMVAPVPVRLADERMTTVVASRRLAERGVRGKRQRAVVDQAAAVEILQSWLNLQRRRT